MVDRDTPAPIPRCRTAGFLLAAALVAARADAAWTTIEAGRGPVALHVPAAHDPARPAPLPVMLHGFGGSALIEESYLALAPYFDAAGFLYATPDGTVDPDGNRYRDATPACCDVYGAHADDVGYLTALVDAIAAEYAVDPRRVDFLGHSNGGFMSYRMACERAERVTAIVSLAGAMFLDPAACAPSRPVRVLEIHGAEDTTIAYDGGVRLAECPGARRKVETWADYDGCGQLVMGLPNFDLGADLPGAETAVEVHESSCAGGAELWSIVGGEHIPNLTAAARQRLVDWLVDAGNRVLLDWFEEGTLDARIVTP